ncbi:glycosyl transferase [Haematococcus lacustris]
MHVDRLLDALTNTSFASSRTLRLNMSGYCVQHDCYELGHNGIATPPSLQLRLADQTWAMGSQRMTRAMWGVGLLVTAVKLLLVPTYRSTDFEVHRNWLAITHSLPVSRWYHEATSEWTLDYPPLFAWFEWGLSHIARLVDPGMLVVANLGYASPATVLFQRLSVIGTDLLLLAGAAALARQLNLQQRPAAGLLLFTLIACNAGLLLVDHIHFQYNGVLTGLLLASLACMQSGQDWLGGVLYAVLLHLKHLYVYCAPLYLVYILRHWCFPPGQPSTQHTFDSLPTPSDPRPSLRHPPSTQQQQKQQEQQLQQQLLQEDALTGREWLGRGLVRLAFMGSSVVAVSAVSLGPFLATGQLHQLLERLFPFKRGLTHAYWAANLWALYSAADRALAALLPRLPSALLAWLQPSLTIEGRGGLGGVGPAAECDAKLEGSCPHAWVDSASGVVGVARFRVLPQVQPWTCLLLLLIGVLPAAISLWRRPHPSRFAAAVAYAGLTGFWLGYHVHEKAVLAAILPLAIPAVSSPSAAQDFLLLSAAGTYGLLPLLYQPQEYPIKLLLLLLYQLLSTSGLSRLHAPLTKSRLLGGPARLYLSGFAGLELYCSLVHSWLLGARLPFLPLMLTSLYCSLGVGWVWLSMARSYLTGAARY